MQNELTTSNMRHSENYKVAKRLINASGRRGALFYCFSEQWMGVALCVAQIIESENNTFTIH